MRETHDTLVRAGLRSRLSLRVDGGLKFSRDIILAAILGADEFGFGTAALLAIGCVMARQCHLNTCPVGIATQDETLRTRFAGKPEMIVAYFQYARRGNSRRMAELGVSSLDELSGLVRFAGYALGYRCLLGRAGFGVAARGAAAGTGLELTGARRFVLFRLTGE